MAFIVTRYDLFIKNGTVIDPNTSTHKKMDIGIYGSRIVDVFEPGTKTGRICGAKVIDAEGMYVVPGLVDAHAHVLPGLRFTYPMDEVWKRGIVACIDLGSNTAATFNRIRYWIDDAPLRVNAAIGMSCMSETQGEIPRHVMLDEEVNADKIKELFDMHPDCLVGVKVYIGHNDSPSAELTKRVLEKGREVCDYANCRMFVHVANPNLPLPEYINYFKAGDVFEHTYNKGNILDGNDNVYAEAWEAKKRGVLFSSARGARNWSSEVAAKAFAQGFTPDLISDDLTCLSNDQYTSRLHVHMGECVAMGMSVDEVIKKVTVDAAKLMVGVDPGIQRGHEANLTILDIDEGNHEFVDAFGVHYNGPVKFTPKATIYQGAIKYNTIETDY